MIASLHHLRPRRRNMLVKHESASGTRLGVHHRVRRGAVSHDDTQAPVQLDEAEQKSV